MSPVRTIFFPGVGAHGRSERVAPRAWHEGGRAHDHVVPVVRGERPLPVELLAARRHAAADGEL